MWGLWFYVFVQSTVFISRLSIPSLAVYIYKKKKKELVEKSAAEQSAQQLWLYTNSLKW